MIFQLKDCLILTGDDRVHVEEILDLHIYEFKECEMCGLPEKGHKVWCEYPKINRLVNLVQDMFKKRKLKTFNDDNMA